MSTLTGLIGGGGGGISPPTSMTTSTSQTQSQFGRLSTSLNNSSSLTTMINLTGPGVLTYLEYAISNNLVSQSHRIVMTVDGTTVFDINPGTDVPIGIGDSGRIWPPAATNQTAGGTGALSDIGGVYACPLVFKSSFLLQHSNGSTEQMLFRCAYFLT